MLQLQPLLIDEDPTKAIYANPDCQSVFESYPAYYYKVGYFPPWIGYWVFRDGIIVGVGGFVGRPENGQVEIAYGTFKQHEGQGVASFACRSLVEIAQTTDPSLIITAKTSPEPNASNTILQRHGFVFTGVVQDDGIGDAWEWVLKNDE